MIRVLHIINDLDIGGAEKMLGELITALRERQVSCEILVLNGKETRLKKELVEIHGFKIYQLTEYSVYNPFLIYGIRRFFKGFDVVHAHLFPSQYWTALAANFLTRKPVLVTTEHSTSNKRRKLRLLRPVERYIYSKYKFIVAVSNDAALHISNYLKYTGPRIHVIENGADLKPIINAIPYKKFELADGFGPDVKIILNVARFEKAKDHGTLIKAMQLLNDDIHLLLAGDGSLRGYYSDMAKKMNLEKRVHFLGIRNDINRLLKSSDIIVMSSFYEGLSLSSIEGMASGKPFIASDVKGLHEVVKDYGILFNPGNPQDLASKITLLLEDRKMYEEISEKCRKRALLFDISRTADAYAKLYSSALE